MNKCTKTDLVELKEFDGEEYLFFKSFTLDVALLRGTDADENGNISFRNESVLNRGLACCRSCKEFGGIRYCSCRVPVKEARWILKT